MFLYAFCHCIIRKKKCIVARLRRALLMFFTGALTVLMYRKMQYKHLDSIITEKNIKEGMCNEKWTRSVLFKKGEWNMPVITHAQGVNKSVQTAVCELSVLLLFSQFCSSPHEAARCCQTRALETEETLITRAGGEERRHRSASHRVCPQRSHRAALRIVPL